MTDPITRAGGQEDPEEGTDATTSQEQGTGHKTKTTSWKVGVFVEKVETQTATPPEYLDPPDG